jgi:hypothetical protein
MGDIQDCKDNSITMHYKIIIFLLIRYNGKSNVFYFTKMNTPALDPV